VIVYVRFLRVLLFFFITRVIMAMNHRRVIVFVRMPVGAVLEFVERVMRVVVGDVIVIVGVRHGGVGMFPLFALAIDALLNSLWTLHSDGTSTCPVALIG
jgi:hypothetical protein